MFVAPDGALLLVPFGTLPMAGGPWLVEVAELRLTDSSNLTYVGVLRGSHVAFLVAY
jgi:hypothetical protein